MFLQVSLILFTGGRACSGGVPAPGGVWSWGVSGPGGVPAPGGPGGEPLPPTATAAGGTHPTGMHSYFGYRQTSEMCNIMLIPIP